MGSPPANLEAATLNAQYGGIAGNAAMSAESYFLPQTIPQTG